MQMKEIEKGSIWRKWDLHIHTPFTKLNNNFTQLENEDIWKTFSDKIEKSDVAAFGITDYFSCENIFTFIEKFKQFHPNSNKKFFPNIEFRLDVAVNKLLEEVNVHVIFSDLISKNQINDFLTHLETNHTNSSGAKISCKNLTDNLIVSATLDINNITNCLRKVFGKDKPYIIVAAANNAGLRPINKSPRKLSLTDEIDKLCDAFFGGEQNVKHFLRTDRFETQKISKPKPVISGSDAHSFLEIDEWLGKVVKVEKDNGQVEVIKNVTWIKADLTFEGLKQILFEPEYRVTISENCPRNAMRRIESIKFNFPDETIIKRNASNEKQPFCLNKLNQPIFFSDYFTSIIGGRGTGKSTIINLIAEKLGEKTDFFNNNNNSLEINGSQYNVAKDPSNFIEIEGTNEIEFVSQGKIEKLAEGNELTKLIFKERIKNIEGQFIDIENKYEEITEAINENISLLFLHKKIQKDISLKTKELEKTKKIVESINDVRYLQISKNIKSYKEELNSIEKSKKEYKVLVEKIRDILLDYKLKEHPNIIDARIQEIIIVLKGIDEIKEKVNDIAIDLKSFDDSSNRVEEINKSLELEIQKLRDFFNEKGTNEETIKDSQKASEDLSRISLEIETLRQQDKRNKEKYDENKTIIKEISEIDKNRRTLINENLSQINKKLEINNESIQGISFKYEFNINAFKKALFEDFYNTFSDYHISGTSKSSVEEVLFVIEPDENLRNLSYEKFVSSLNDKIDANNYRRSNNYVKMIFEIFDKNENFLIYRNILIKHLYNSSKYASIKGFYGKRELESCSFGQKCTAVIITLLMTGVKPLVIDEPEAHLDNKLIADFLVNLIKRKQYDRQIIFASHNSNFVINGDSGIIHILEIPNNNVYTNRISTTIENTLYREQLLKLEGGKEAFITRESKYGI
jgi:DNA repair protein SbcC/Rad50